LSRQTLSHFETSTERDFIFVIRKIIDFCVGLLAARAEAADINRVWVEEGNVHKCRRWWGWVLILIGNPVLACRQVPVGVLFNSQWLRWEREVKRAVNGETVSPGRVLICNQLSGVPLADWLAEFGATKEARLEVLKKAVNGLREFHRVQVDNDRGDSIPLSHGDATLNNVLYDVENDSLQWIDFDLRHWLNVPAPQRHADDLRAFLFSAVRHLPDDEIPEFLSAMQQQYDAPPVWSCLRAQLSSRWFRLDVFHQAQIQRGRKSKDSTRSNAQKFTSLESLICQ